MYYLDVPRANERIGSFVRESCRFVSLFDQSVAIVGHGNEDVTFAQICKKGHPLNCVILAVGAGFFQLFIPTRRCPSTPE